MRPFLLYDRVFAADFARKAARFRAAEAEFLGQGEFFTAYRLAQARGEDLVVKYLKIKSEFDGVHWRRWNSLVDELKRQRLPFIPEMDILWPDPDLLVVIMAYGSPVAMDAHLLQHFESRLADAGYVIADFLQVREIRGEKCIIDLSHMQRRA